METMYINQEGRSIDIGVEGYKPQNYYDYSLREAIKRYREKNGLVGNHFKKWYGRFYAYKGAYGRYYYY